MILALDTILMRLGYSARVGYGLRTDSTKLKGNRLTLSFCKTALSACECVRYECLAAKALLYLLLNCNFSLPDVREHRCQVSRARGLPCFTRRGCVCVMQSSVAKTCPLRYDDMKPAYETLIKIKHSIYTSTH